MTGRNGWNTKARNHFRFRFDLHRFYLLVLDHLSDVADDLRWKRVSERLPLLLKVVALLHVGNHGRGRNMHLELRLKVNHRWRQKKHGSIELRWLLRIHLILRLINILSELRGGWEAERWTDAGHFDDRFLATHSLAVAKSQVYFLFELLDLLVFH